MRRFENLEAVILTVKISGKVPPQIPDRTG
jgi:hypothetical protein